MAHSCVERTDGCLATSPSASISSRAALKLGHQSFHPNARSVWEGVADISEIASKFLKQVGLYAATNPLRVDWHVMSTDVVANAVDRTIVTYTKMGLRGDQERRQMLREIAKEYIQGMFEQGQQDQDKLVVDALKHLVSLEGRPPLRRDD